MKLEYASHIIKRGENIRTISTLYNLENWQEIANANSLDYPFIVDNPLDHPGKNTKSAGDLILIPLSSEEVVPLVSTSELEDLAYGKDLLVVHQRVFGDTDGVELYSDTYGDLEISRGLTNLKQALLLRLMTGKGELILHPEYGSELPYMLGVKGTEDNKIKIGLEVEGTIRQDFRVKDVSNVKISLFNRTCEIECTIHPISPLSPFVFRESVSLDYYDSSY